jgi:hypothetical protein
MSGSTPRTADRDRLDRFREALQGDRKKFKRSFCWHGAHNDGRPEPINPHRTGDVCGSITSGVEAATLRSGGSSACPA